MIFSHSSLSYWSAGPPGCRDNCFLSCFQSKLIWGAAVELDTGHVLRMEPVLTITILIGYGYWIKSQPGTWWGDITCWCPQLPLSPSRSQDVLRKGSLSSTEIKGKTPEKHLNLQPSLLYRLIIFNSKTVANAPRINHVLFVRTVLIEVLNWAIGFQGGHLLFVVILL